MHFSGIDLIVPALLTNGLDHSSLGLLVAPSQGMILECVLAAAQIAVPMGITKEAVAVGSGETRAAAQAGPVRAETARFTDRIESLSALSKAQAEPEAAWPGASGPLLSAALTSGEIQPEFSTSKASTLAVIVPGIATRREALALETQKRAEQKARLQSTRRMWLALSASQHAAAAFDAWTTRKMIADRRGKELNPLLRPVANSDGLYPVMQIAPAVTNWLGHKAARSSRSWVRRTWWLPQAVATAGFIVCGINNWRVQPNTR